MLFNRLVNNAAKEKPRYNRAYSRQDRSCFRRSYDASDNDEGLPLAYNKDMQEDKEAIFDAFDTVKICLTTFIPMLDTMTAIPENMRKAAAGGFINATDCADYLVGKDCRSVTHIRPQVK